MSLIQDLIEWASSGDVSPAYDDAKKALGWVVGEPPSAPSWNEVENARDRMINRSKKIALSKGTCSPDMTPESLCAGQIFGHDWANVSNALNNLTLPDEVWDACVCWDASTETPFVLAITAGTAVQKISGCWDHESAISDEELTLAFPSTPDGILSLACDGTLAYVAWYAGAGNLMVTAFPLADLEGTAAWTCDTGTLGSDAIYAKLVYCSGLDTLGVVTRVTGQIYRRLYTIDTTDGSLVASGTGSWVTGYGNSSDLRSRPIHWGNHVWWIQFQAGSPRTYYLISAKVSAPSTSDFASVDLGDYSNDWEYPQALAWINNGIVISGSNGTLHMYEPARGLYRDEWVTVTSPIGVNRESTQDTLLCGDGMNLWFLGAHANSDPIVRHVAYKIPSGVFLNIGDQGAPFEVPCGAVIIDTASGDHADVEETDIGGRLLFDGMDVWCILRSGMVFRITNPGGR